MRSTPDVKRSTIAPRDILGGIQLNNAQRTGLAVSSFAGALALWWLLTATGLVDKVLLPAPEEVATAFSRSIVDGSLVRHTGISLLRVLEGFLIALTIAVPVGVVMGSWQIARGLLEPMIELLRPIPPIAMIPLAILWFGIDELSKVLIIAYGAFFPILLNTVAGFQEVDRTHIRAAQTLGATRLQIFRDVI